MKNSQPELPAHTHNAARKNMREMPLQITHTHNSEDYNAHTLHTPPQIWEYTAIFTHMDISIISYSPNDFLLCKP